MTYKVGDIFKFENIDIDYKTSEDDIWESTDEWGEYKIFKISKTLIYFDDLDYNGSNFLIVKKKDFEKYAIFERKETKKIIGYKLIKESLNSKVGDIYDLNGVCSLNELVDFSSGKSMKVNTPISKLSDTSWFEPIFEEEFKVGDYIYYLKDLSYAKAGDVAKITEIAPTWWTLMHFRVDGFDQTIYKNSYRKATPEEIKKYTTIKIGEFTAEIDKSMGVIKFGCQALTKDDIISVKKLLNTEINASITIHGTKINLELINKILNQL